VGTISSIQSLNRRCEESDKSERNMKRRIITLESSVADLRKENHAFRIETEQRFEIVLQTVQENFETSAKRQKEDVDALKKEIKDLEMLGEQQRSQISNLKPQLSLQIAQIEQIEGISTRRRSTRSIAAASL
jgi:archaellum component FlaC